MPQPWQAVAQRLSSIEVYLARDVAGFHLLPSGLAYHVPSSTRFHSGARRSGCVSDQSTVAKHRRLARSNKEHDTPTPTGRRKSFGDCLLKAICKRSFRKSCDDNILSYVISIFMKAVGRTLDMPGSAVQDVGAWRLYCSRLCIRYVAPSSESVSSQAYHAVSPTETAIV